MLNMYCRFSKITLILRPGEANPTVGLYFVKMDDLNTEIKVDLDVQERILHQMQVKILHQNLATSISVTYFGDEMHC